MIRFYEQLQALLRAGAPCVSVTLVNAIGSIPQTVGAKMLVSRDGLHAGTIGGGKLEKKTIEEALHLLSEPLPEESTLFRQWNLRSDVGMTCGGSVSLFFERFNPNDWPIYIFGAGHVAQSLIPLLLTLDCRITCVDPRADWLAKLPESERLTCIQLENMASFVPELPDNGFVVLVTMGHTSDKPILLEILRTRQLPYVGVIGSKAKAAILRKDVREAGLPAEMETAFYCPVGLEVGGNHPPEIAISIVAQLLRERDNIRRT